MRAREGSGGGATGGRGKGGVEMGVGVEGQQIADRDAKGNVWTVRLTGEWMMRAVLTLINNHLLLRNK